MSRLWYDHPASEWEEALPIGMAESVPWSTEVRTENGSR